MGFKFDQPLYSLSDEAEQQKILEAWGSEKYGGLSAGNNRIPFPITFLLALIILTAFMITMPIWGQRPNAEIYEDYIKLMDSPEVQRLATDDEKMKYVANAAYQMADGRRKAALERHPMKWEDLLNIAPAIKEVQAGHGKYRLAEYSVMGDHLAVANFEGNIINGRHERVQPWWDLGYSIDVFYVSYFCITMVLVIKRLPHFSRKPDMSKAR